MEKKKIIKSTSQDNWDKLSDELNYIHQRIDEVEGNISALKLASNATMLTMEAILKILIEKDIISNKELDKKLNLMSKSMKKRTEKENEKIKKENKQILFDALLKSDLGGNA